MRFCLSSSSSALLSLIFILAILIDMEWHLLCLWFVFPNSYWCWTSFYVFICHPHIFFSEMSHVFYPISKWSFWILLLSFWDFFVYSKQKFFVRYVVCKYFLPQCNLSFNPLYRDFCRAKDFNFDEFQIIHLFSIIQLCFCCCV